MRTPFYLASLGSLLISVSSFSEEAHQQRIFDTIDSIARQHSEIEENIRQLRILIGQQDLSVTTLSPLEPEPFLPERVQVRTQDGIKAFKEKKFNQAKESFRVAWEEMPGSYLTNFNLGLAYYNLGNQALSTKFFKSAIEVNKEFTGSEQVKKILFPKLEDEILADTNESEDKLKSIEMQNLSKENETYLKSGSMSMPEKMEASVQLLNEMLAVSKDNKELIREYYLKISNSFAAFELYGKALEVLTLYQEQLEGEVLPDSYYTQILSIEEKKKAQDIQLAKLMNNKPTPDIQHRLQRDLSELSVFSAQLEDFVEKADKNDPDFKKLCERLGEYRWGNKEDRHVIIVNRFQELLYSSLPGTLPIDRYQDINGNKFLKEITYLSPSMQAKQAEFFPVELKVRHDTIPYVILYTYSQKHQAFIIIRLPREDLS